MRNYLSETWSWLLSQQQDGGWGIYPGENNRHLPITAEVVVALAMAKRATGTDQLDAALDASRIYLESELQNVATGTKPKSTVHAAWLVLAVLTLGTSTNHPGLAETIALLLDAQQDGWSWQLSPAEPKPGAVTEVYPTYLALWAISIAQQHGINRVPKLPGISTWLTTSRDQWFRTGEAIDGEQLLRTAYGLQCFLLVEQIFPGQSVGHGNLSSAFMSCLSNASLSKPIIRETGFNNAGQEIPWHHCLVQQACLAAMRLIDGLPDRTRVICLLLRVTKERYFVEGLGSNATWHDEVRKCPTSYVASDTLHCLALWEEQVTSLGLLSWISIDELGEAYRSNRNDGLDRADQGLVQLPSTGIFFSNRGRQVATLAGISVLGVAIWLKTVVFYRFPLILLLLAVVSCELFLISRSKGRGWITQIVVLLGVFGTLVGLLEVAIAHWPVLKAFVG